jgi:opacity protein-like surface antigen
MKRLALAAFAFAAVLPAMAQSSEPVPPPKHSMKDRWFVGGSFGASFGTVDSISVSPLVGFHVTPRFDVGLQLFYRWIDDGRYSPSITTNDYGTTLFARARVVANFFLEADIQFTSYEYPTGTGTARSNYNTFLAGAGYAFPLGHNASFYVSALYDFRYDANAAYVPYDSPWVIQIGAAVGF